MCTMVPEYSRVQQKSLSINNQRSHDVCTMIVQQYYRTKSERAETEIQLTLSRIECSTVEPTENVQ